jgi:hypothetical protein
MNQNIWQFYILCLILIKIYKFTIFPETSSLTKTEKCLGRFSRVLRRIFGARKEPQTAEKCITRNFIFLLEIVMFLDCVHRLMFTMFTTGCYWSLPMLREWIQFTSSHPISIRSSLILSSCLCPHLPSCYWWNMIKKNVWNEAMSIFKFYLHFLQQFS